MTYLRQKETHRDKLWTLLTIFYSFAGALWDLFQEIDQEPAGQCSPPQSSCLRDTRHFTGQAGGSRTQQPSRGASAAPTASQLHSKASVFLSFPRAKQGNPTLSLFHLCVHYLTTQSINVSLLPITCTVTPDPLSSPSPRGYQPTAPEPSPQTCATAKGRGWREHPGEAPLHPNHVPAQPRAYSAVRPAACLATGTGDSRDEGNFSPFHASF